MLSFNEYKAIVNEHLTDFIPDTGDYASVLRESMEYSLTIGGKRLRPVLLLAACDFAGGDIGSALPYACSLEYIHTYSLIHDDLPAMDDDSLRRGRPTVHVAFGEDIAILAGDGLLNFAYELAAFAMELSPEKRSVELAMRILARRPGLYGMLGGQTADVTLSGSKLSEKQLTFIYANKTAALLECAMQIGAVLGGATAFETEQIRKAAYAAGIAFQVQDDILDQIGDAEVLGKEVGQDERNEKTTYVTLHGLDAAKQYVQYLTDEANKVLREIFSEENAPAADLVQLLQSLVNRNK